jgi:hypothetical protein
MEQVAVVVEVVVVEVGRSDLLRIRCNDFNNV